MFATIRSLYGIISLMRHWLSVIGLSLLVASLILGILYLLYTLFNTPVTYSKINEVKKTISDTVNKVTKEAWPKELDKETYDKLLLDLVDYQAPQPATTTATSTATTTDSLSVESDLVHSSTSNVTVAGAKWPPKAPYPNGGAILPFHRVVAYYGNFYSPRMGILGEHSREKVISHLASTTEKWEAADPDTPVLPAIHYIAMVAQGGAGSDGMYRNVMPDEEIDKAYDMAKEIDGIMFLDLQIGLSTIERELPKFEKYLKRPDVHLAIDPEFAMYGNYTPGEAIGTFDAKEINYVIDYLSDLVEEHELPPKILVVHRFTQDMVTNYEQIKPTPQVQVVMHMDGWGSKSLKRGTYRRVIEPEPVQFVGLKIFFKNDLKPPSTGIFQPEEAVELHPEPIYIQYQ